MKKEIFAVAILVALAALAVWNIIYVGHVTDSLAAEITAGDTELALQHWLDAEPYARVMLRHESADSITDAFYALLARERDGGDASVERRHLVYRLDNLRKTENVSIGTVF